MPELPEIRNLSLQIADELTGKTIVATEVRQEKCLNTPVADFERLVVGKTLGRAYSRGKWLFVPLSDDALFLLSLGMGGDAILHQPDDALPDKYQVKLAFDDGCSLTIAFWWFGYAHAVPVSQASQHTMTSSLGLDPLNPDEFTYETFARLIAGSRRRIKSLLMDQKLIAGIGNVYIQDTLFRAGLHPDRKASDMNDAETERLHQAIIHTLTDALELGGLAYERDLHGQPGRFKDFLVGYREGHPCPACGAPIEKIKTGTTASFVCVRCQR